MRIRPALRHRAGEQAESELTATPDCAEAEHVPHFMQDYQLELVVRVESRDVGGVEVHETDEGQFARRPDVARAGLPQDLPGPVDRIQGHKDDDIANYLADRPRTAAARSAGRLGEASCRPCAPRPV